MKLLNRLTINNLKLNKKRTIVTIIGIMLSVALITSVATIYSSMIKTLINYEVYEKGYFHATFYDVSYEDTKTIKNINGVDEIYLTKGIGYATLENSKNEYKPYAYIMSFTESALNNLSVKLACGRLPENDNEIVIPTHLKTNGRISLNIGDEITLDIGTRDSNGYELNQSNSYTDDESIINTVSKTYKIVGIIERPATNIEGYSAPGYTFITLMNEIDNSSNYNVYVKYTKEGSKDYINVTATILGVDKNLFNKALNGVEMSEYATVDAEMEKAKYTYDLNTYLITLENTPLDNDTMGDLGTVVIIVMVIIVITSVFCIKNSFDISITEKIRQYGMLRSIGATKKQIKKNVFYEATILAIIGIPLGLLLGLLASYILIIICNFYLKDMINGDVDIVLSYSWIAFIVSILLGLITIYLSSLRSAIKASKVTPIDSIKNSKDLKLKSKKLKTPKLIKKIFKAGGNISYKNIKRNKKKYRTTIISITISVAVFIGLSYFVSNAFSSVKTLLGNYNYNIELSINMSDEIVYNKVLDTTKLDNIKEYTIVRCGYVTYAYNSSDYTEEYINYMKSVSNWLDDPTSSISIYIVNDDQFKNYVEELGLKYESVKDKGILYNKEIVYENNKSNSIDIYTYHEGDNITGKSYDWSGDSQDFTIEIGYITDTKLSSLSSNYSDGGSLIVSDKYYADYTYGYGYVFYDSNNADTLQDDIDKVLDGESYNLTNLDEQVRLMNNLYTLVAIFLYGFIIVVSLIGITNIFNTITTSMELRKQEFAILKSVGMTRKEFNNMIRLESIFIGFKSLIIGIILGLIISYIIYKNMYCDTSIVFKFPIIPIIISIVVVYLLITLLMKYSMSKINKQNTIETIRNENI